MDRNVNLRVVDGSKSSVALRKESVDRNASCFTALLKSVVALRKESVDRNITATRIVIGCVCRSPQGERG